MDHFVVIKMMAAKHLLRPNPTDVCTAPFNRIDADVATVKEVEFNGIAGRTLEVGFESEEAATPGGSGLAPVSDDVGPGGSTFGEDLGAAAFCRPTQEHIQPVTAEAVGWFS